MAIKRREDTDDFGSKHAEITEIVLATGRLVASLCGPLTKEFYGTNL
jgi:hypothetical protein